MEFRVGPILLIVVLMLMALFAVSVFLFSRKSRSSVEDDDPLDE
ncbi:Cbb3-type cytochrome oxidase subunit 3 [Sporosarcina sp. ANT_H38]|nr:hypothetical protein [Sporosarcina sp. ANT_H38]